MSYNWKPIGRQSSVNSPTIVSNIPYKISITKKSNFAGGKESLISSFTRNEAADKARFRSLCPLPKRQYSPFRSEHLPVNPALQPVGTADTHRKSFHEPGTVRNCAG